jgi:hypothetical protein
MRVSSPVGEASHKGKQNAGAMAQLVAHLLCKQGVRGSSPLGSTAKVLVIGMFAPSSVDVDRAAFHENFTRPRQWSLRDHWQRPRAPFYGR